jgi:hypothetical protein
LIRRVSLAEAFPFDKSRYGFHIRIAQSKLLTISESGIKSRAGKNEVKN